MTDATQFDGRPSSAPPIAVSSFPAVVAHACYLIYPLPVGEQPMGPTLTLGDLANTHASPAAGGKAAATRWLAPEALATITDERRARPVWEAGSLAPGDDLYPHVQRLLGGGTSAVADVLPSAESVPSPKSHTCVWRLSESGRKLVQGQRLAYPPATPKEGRLPRSLCIRLSKSARTRIAARVPGFDADGLGIAILDWMLAELDRDSAQIDAYLSQAAARKAAEHARRQDQRFRWASVIGIFGLSWLTSFTIAKEILELRPVHDWLHLSQDLVPLAATAIGLVVAVVAALVTAMTGRHPHGLAEHAQHETVIHAAHH